MLYQDYQGIVRATSETHVARRPNASPYRDGHGRWDAMRSNWPLYTRHECTQKTEVPTYKLIGFFLILLAFASTANHEISQTDYQFGNISGPTRVGTKDWIEKVEVDGNTKSNYRSK